MAGSSHVHSEGTERRRRIMAALWHLVNMILFASTFRQVTSKRTRNLSRLEMERLRQLDQHYQIMMRTSDRYSTPFKRITRLYHVLVHKKLRTHVRINDKLIDANGMDKSKDAYLVIESDSFGTIKIHSMQEPIYYLCIGKDGKPVGVPKVQLHAQLVDTNNCIFKEQFTHKHVLFKSVKYYNESKNTGCLAFNKNGRGRRISRSKCGHRSTLFLERKSRIIIDIHNDGPLRSKLISLLRKERARV